MPSQRYQRQGDDDERDELRRALVVFEEDQFNGSAHQAENEEPADEAFFGHGRRPRLSPKTQKTPVF
jgi:hypothetical protein